MPSERLFPDFLTPVPQARPRSIQSELAILAATDPSVHMVAQDGHRLVVERDASLLVGLRALLSQFAQLVQVERPTQDQHPGGEVDVAPAPR